MDLALSDPAADQEMVNEMRLTVSSMRASADHFLKAALALIEERSS